MNIVTTLPLRVRRNAHEIVGLVPTMGFLHEGHVSLVKRAKEECDLVVMSIFVNPLQFGPNEDFDRYPRDIERDQAIAEEAGVDVLFMPDVETMYPRPMRTKVTVSEVTETLCGASRPGHFDGVATVVMKLFQMIRPDKAYFGMKDAQQVAVVQTMVEDLNVPVDIVPCPILREADGLAMSSRNVYLTHDERRQATILHETLQLAERWARVEQWTAGQLRENIIAKIQSSPLAKIDYAEIVTYPRLEPVPVDARWDATAAQSAGSGRWLIAVAVYFGKTRLIDNLLV